MLSVYIYCHCIMQTQPSMSSELQSALKMFLLSCPHKRFCKWKLQQKLPVFDPELETEDRIYLLEDKNQSPQEESEYI